MKIKLLIVSLLCISLIATEVIEEDKRFDRFNNRTSIKHIVSFQLVTTNTEQNDISLDYTKDKKDAETLERPGLLQTSISAVISTSIRSTLKNRNLIENGYFMKLIKTVGKDVGSSLVMKSIFWFIPRNYKTMSQLSLFVLTNSYLCFGKSFYKVVSHLFREILKMIGYIGLLFIVAKLSKNFVVKAVLFGLLSFFWDFLVKMMVESIFGYMG